MKFNFVFRIMPAMFSINQLGAALFILNLLSGQAAVAGSFGDKFESWLLDSNVQVASPGNNKPDVGAEACLQCHNGTGATHIAVKNAAAPMQFSKFGVQTNHPVGMSYDYYALASPSSYTPGNLLDPNITLVAGRVTCVSCHQIKQAKPTARSYKVASTDFQSAGVGIEFCSVSSELTVGPRQADLYLACHNM